MWNSALLYNYSKKRDIAYSYEFHQSNLNKIYTRKYVPSQSFEKISPHDKVIKNRQFDINLENQNLLHKVSEIKSTKGSYSQENISKTSNSKKNNLNIESRITAIKKIMDENQFLEKRLKTVPSTINNKEFHSFYQINKQYSSSIRKFNEKRANGLLINTTYSFSKNLDNENPSTSKARNNFQIKTYTSNNSSANKSTKSLFNNSNRTNNNHHKDNINSNNNDSLKEEHKNSEKNLTQNENKEEKPDKAIENINNIENTENNEKKNENDNEKKVGGEGKEAEITEIKKEEKNDNLEENNGFDKNQIVEIQKKVE